MQLVTWAAEGLVVEMIVYLFRKLVSALVTLKNYNQMDEGVSIRKSPGLRDISSSDGVPGSNSDGELAWLRKQIMTGHTWSLLGSAAL
jgi:hypothetical protein